MTVPETSMHEDRDFPARKYNIGSTRQALGMKSVSISQAMKKATYLPFRSRVLGLDRLHDATALARRPRIGHDNRERTIISMASFPRRLFVPTNRSEADCEFRA